MLRRCCSPPMRSPRRRSTLPVHIGVNWGPVFAGEVGPGYRRTYTVMGDTVNLAARLMAQAGPGEVLATRDVLGLSRTLFLTERREPFHVKGKQHPVTAHEVGAPCGTREAADAGIPLIGRDEELAALEDSWRSAEASEGKAGRPRCRAGDGEEPASPGVPRPYRRCPCRDRRMPPLPGRDALFPGEDPACGPCWHHRHGSGRNGGGAARCRTARRPRVDAMAVAPRGCA